MYNFRYFLGSEITMIKPTDLEFLELLLMYGAEANVYDRSGLTPLMKACRSGSVYSRFLLAYLARFLVEEPVLGREKSR